MGYAVGENLPECNPALEKRYHLSVLPQPVARECKRPFHDANG